MKVVFFGTPEFAVPSLEKLILEPSIEVLAVVTQPDKAVGRKQIITAPPVKVLAQKHGIEVFQPDKLNSSVIASGAKQSIMQEILMLLKPDLIITCAYGQILKKTILDLAPVVNVHASLLPDYRGPAPINWMLIHGESEVGVTTMLSDEGVDTGAILLKSSIQIDDTIKADELSKTLSELGADLLLETILNFKEITPQVQSSSVDPEKQLAPFMDKTLGMIDFRKESFELRSANPKQTSFKVVKKNAAKNIHNLIRASYPWPGAYFMYGEEKIIITDSGTQQNDTFRTGSLGQIVAVDKTDGSFSVQTCEGALIIKKLKAQGKAEMQAAAWLNGLRLKEKDFL